MLEAYEKLDAADVEDEKTKSIKAEYPSFGRVDYWWLDDLVDDITFGLHEREDDRTLTVHWNCGKETTIDSGIESMKKIRYRRKSAERRAMPKKGIKRVRKIAAKPKDTRETDQEGQLQTDLAEGTREGGNA